MGRQYLLEYIIAVTSSRLFSQGDSTLTPSALTSEYMDASTATGAVSSFFITTIQGLCYATPAGGWPRDKLYCNFILQPASNEEFNLTQDSRKFSDNVVSFCSTFFFFFAKCRVAKIRLHCIDLKVIDKQFVLVAVSAPCSHLPITERLLCAGY